MKPKVLILRTAGINCDKETEFAFTLAGAKTDLRHINNIQQNKDLSKYQVIAIPGGFSYGDDLGAGKVFSLELLLWLKDELKQFIRRGGLIIGICNGFQVLVKTGILPDLDFKQKVTLTANDSGRFEDRWVYLKIRRQKSGDGIWFKGLPEIITLPVAHGEGKFYTESDILDKIENSAAAILKYVDLEGNFAGYPFNPNGAINSIAGFTDRSGKVLGLMPHPERFTFKHHYPFWQREAVVPFGLKIFKNAINYFK